MEPLCLMICYMTLGKTLFSGPVPSAGMTGLDGANLSKPHDVLPTKEVKLGVENRSSGVCLASELSPHFLAV